MLSTDNWCIKVAQRIYGPYTMDQLTEFAREGRLTGSTMLSPAGGNMWRAARQYPAFHALLDKSNKKTKKGFGKNKTAQSSGFEEGAIVNFIIMFDVISGAASRLEQVIRNLGPAFRLTDNVWTVQSELSVVGVKNEIVPHLQVREPVFIVDCQRGRSVWQNFVPETHARLSKAWTGIGVQLH